MEKEEGIVETIKKEIVGKNMKKIVRIFLGIFLSFLGLLWFLQGADIVHIAPILCFSNCGIMTGGSQFWLATGVITFIVGIIIIGYKKVNNKI